MSGEALRQAGVEVPEGVDGSEVVSLITDLLKAVAEARILGRFDIARDVNFGTEHWRVRLRGHRRQDG